MTMVRFGWNKFVDEVWLELGTGCYSKCQWCGSRIIGSNGLFPSIFSTLFRACLSGPLDILISPIHPLLVWLFSTTFSIISGFILDAFGHHFPRLCAQSMALLNTFRSTPPMSRRVRSLLSSSQFSSTSPPPSAHSPSKTSPRLS